MVTALCVPQWQGSSAPTARRLAAGAHRTASLVPASRVVTVPVSEAAGNFDQGVKALDVLVSNASLIAATLSDISDPVVVAGGECGVDLAPIAGARTEHAPPDDTINPNEADVIRRLGAALRL
jgi:arginase